VTISAPATNVTVFAGTTVNFAATATSPSDGTISNALDWGSDKAGPLFHGASFSTNALAIGTHVITAAVTNIHGLLGSAQRTVVVRGPNVPPTITIQAPTNGAALLTGKPV